jgi:hypothetical protein
MGARTAPPRKGINKKAAEAPRSLRPAAAAQKPVPPARREDLEGRASRRTAATVPPSPPDRPDEDIEEPLVDVPTSFNLDLRRTTRHTAELEETPDKDPNSAEALAAGDREVSPESAAFVGDETPGGDNPTPDMDVVDLVGRSLGVEYEDAEELKGAEKIAERDRKRWELDPASSEDYRDRNRS